MMEYWSVGMEGLPSIRCQFDEGKRPKVIRLHFVQEEVIAA